MHYHLMHFQEEDKGWMHHKQFDDLHCCRAKRYLDGDNRLIALLPIPSFGKDRKSERHNHRIANDKRGIEWRRVVWISIVHILVAGTPCTVYTLYKA
jgi:hypothetical protein